MQVAIFVADMDIELLVVVVDDVEFAAGVVGNRQGLVLLLELLVVGPQLVGEGALDYASHPLQFALQIFQLYVAIRDRLLVVFMLRNQFVLFVGDRFQLRGKLFGQCFKLLPILDTLL